MRRPLLAFLVAFAVVAASGVMQALWANARGGFDLGGFLSGLSSLGTFVLASAVFSIEAVVIAVVTARHRRVRVWLAAYAGVVLGVAPFFALAAVFENASCAATGYYEVVSCISTLVDCPAKRVPCPTDVLGPTVGALLVSALAAGLIFLVAGGLAYLVTGTSSQPTDREA
jgi:hypothetical protein